jgi:hypothetical protein
MPETLPSASGNFKFLHGQHPDCDQENCPGAIVGFEYFSISAADAGAP